MAGKLLVRNFIFSSTSPLPSETVWPWREGAIGRPEAGQRQAEGRPD